MDAEITWFEEAEEGCTWKKQALPSGEAVAVQVIGGECDIEALAPHAQQHLLLRAEGHTLQRLADGVVTEMPAPDGWMRHVAWTAEGAPLVLTADSGDAGFLVRTWAFANEEWQLREESTQDLATVLAISGGPVWGTRAPGSTYDAWTLESTPGFVLRQPRQVKVPKDMAMDAVLWGVVPFEGGEILVRYTILAAPRPVGPVLLREGKKVRLVDDHRFFEQRVGIEVIGTWMLVSYAGMNPFVIDLTTGKTAWSTPDEAYRTGARIVPR